MVLNNKSNGGHANLKGLIKKELSTLVDSV